MIARVLIALCAVLMSTVLFATNKLSAWYSSDADHQLILNVDLFLSSSCPYCRNADAFFSEVEKKNPWIVVHRYLINQDKSALITFNKRLQQQKTQNFTVPAIFFCDSRWVGFDSAKAMGNSLLQALGECRYEIQQKHQLTPLYVAGLRQQSYAAMVSNGIKAVQWGVLNSVAFFAFADALSPCALYFLLLGFAFLALCNNAIKTQLMVLAALLGSLFIAHLLLHGHASYQDETVHAFRLCAVFVGIMLSGYAVYRYRRIASVKINAISSYPKNILLLLLIVLSAINLYFFQQRCQGNFQSVFDQWLTTQAMSHQQILTQRLLYAALSVIPMFVLLGGYLMMLHRTYLLKHRCFLQRVACVVLLCIGLLLLLHPVWLASFWFSLVVLLAALISGFID